MELKAYINAKWCPHMKRYDFMVYPFDATSQRYILLKEVTLDVEVPSTKVLDTKTVAVLQAKLKKLKGDHYVEEQKLQAQIDEKLAIEHKPEPAESFA